MGPHERLLKDQCAVSEARGFTATARASTASSFGIGRQPLPCTGLLSLLDAAGPHRELMLELSTSLIAGAAPGQLACLMDGELIVGWGTIVR